MGLESFMKTIIRPQLLGEDSRLWEVELVASFPLFRSSISR
jgi:hypothetical protein